MVARTSCRRRQGGRWADDEAIIWPVLNRFGPRPHRCGRTHRRLRTSRTSSTAALVSLTGNLAEVVLAPTLRHLRQSGARGAVREDRQGPLRLERLTRLPGSSGAGPLSLETCYFFKAVLTAGR